MADGYSISARDVAHSVKVRAYFLLQRHPASVDFAQCARPGGTEYEKYDKMPIIHRGGYCRRALAFKTSTADHRLARSFIRADSTLMKQSHADLSALTRKSAATKGTTNGCSTTV